jgi:hypothetical protein
MFGFVFALAWSLHAATPGHSSGHPKAGQDEPHEDKPEDKENEKEEKLENRVCCGHVSPFSIHLSYCTSISEFLHKALSRREAKLDEEENTWYNYSV